MNTAFITQVDTGYQVTITLGETVLNFQPVVAIQDATNQITSYFAGLLDGSITANQINPNLLV